MFPLPAGAGAGEGAPPPPIGPALPMGGLAPAVPTPPDMLPPRPAPGPAVTPAVLLPGDGPPPPVPQKGSAAGRACMGAGELPPPPLMENMSAATPLACGRAVDAGAVGGEALGALPASKSPSMSAVAPLGLASGLRAGAGAGAETVGRAVTCAGDGAATGGLPDTAAAGRGAELDGVVDCEAVVAKRETFRIILPLKTGTTSSTEFKSSHTAQPMHAQQRRRWAGRAVLSGDSAGQANSQLALY